MAEWSGSGSEAVRVRGEARQEPGAERGGRERRGQGGGKGSGEPGRCRQAGSEERGTPTAARTIQTLTVRT